MKFILSIMIFILSGCSHVYNYDRAGLYARDGSFFVELKGQRKLMSHDIFSSLKGDTYEETKILNIPRDSGRIDGNEIEVEKGYYKYIGFIDILANKIVIDLKYDNTDTGEASDTGWSGEYALIRRSVVPR